MTVAEIQELYDLGKFPEAIAAVGVEVSGKRASNDPEIGKLCVICAWCYWRRQEWDGALVWLGGAEKAGGAELETKRLRAYFAAYRDKNDGVLRSIAQELPGDVGVLNALVIRARDEDSAFSHVEVENIVFAFEAGDVTVANLYHNGARFFMAKPRDNEDLFMAVGMLDHALRLYGTDGNWHHRAAATHWQSVAHERLGETEDDRNARSRARQLWEKASELDPANQGFQQNLENARKREAEFAS
jgi:hypothetical protein